MMMIQQLRILPPTLFVFLVLSVPSLLAQSDPVDTFYVAVVKKTEAHPYFKRGYDSGFTVNGREGVEITLERKKTYMFQMEDIPRGYFFYIALFPDGSGAPEWLPGVSRNFIDRDQSMTFEVPNDAPDTLYYASGSYLFAGGRILIVDSITTSVGEEVKSHTVVSLGKASVSPNPFSSVTTINLQLNKATPLRLEVSDLLGNRVHSQVERELRKGTHKIFLDASNWSSGTYFYRIIALDGKEQTISTGQLQRIQ